MGVQREGARLGRQAARMTRASRHGKKPRLATAAALTTRGGPSRRNDVGRIATSIPVEHGVGRPTLPAMTDPAAPEPLRVLLVDPDDRVRESLAGLLCIGHRCVVIGSAGSADAAVRIAADTEPDVIVLDPRLPGEDGSALIAQLRTAAPTSRVLVLSWSETADPATGADAYIRKTFRPHELIDAVVAATSRSGA